MSGGITSALPEMLGRLKLNGIRDRIDDPLDEAAGRDLTMPETLALLCEAEVAHREKRRIAHLFFALIGRPYERVGRRYERGSMLVTSNRSVSEWERS